MVRFSDLSHALLFLVLPSSALAQKCETTPELEAVAERPGAGTPKQTDFVPRPRGEQKRLAEGFQLLNTWSAEVNV